MDENLYNSPETPFVLGVLVSRSIPWLLLANGIVSIAATPIYFGIGAGVWFCLTCPLLYGALCITACAIWSICRAKWRPSKSRL